MNQIYLDWDQCELFGLKYWGVHNSAIRADRILASKSNGYDDYHYNLLGPYRAQVVKIAREEGDSPGWYKVLVND